MEFYQVPQTVRTTPRFGVKTFHTLMTISLITGVGGFVFAPLWVITFFCLCCSGNIWKNNGEPREWG